MNLDVDSSLFHKSMFSFKRVVTEMKSKVSGEHFHG